jgi:hypothetical protein
MNPLLMDGEFVFCSLPQDADSNISSKSIAVFRESEGLSVVLNRQVADEQGLNYEFVAKMITLQIHSSLHAIGFLAAIARELAQADIGLNPISAYFHDYLFVPAEKAGEAMRILERMSESDSANS